MLRRFATAAARGAAAWIATQSLAIRRSSRRQVAFSVALGAVAAAAAGTLLVDLSSSSAELGRRVRVAVATVRLTPGDEVSHASIALRWLPVVAVPATAVTDLPLGGTVRQHVAPGEVLTRLDLSTTSAPIPDGWRSVAIAVPNALPPLQQGDRVDVISASVVLAPGAVVVDVGDDGIIVAVPADVAPAVATAAAVGDATLAGGG